MKEKRSRTSKIFIVLAIVGITIACVAVVATYWSVGSPLSCYMPTQGPVEAGWSVRTVESDGMERCYFLYAPSGYDPNQEIPLVFSYHGFLSNPNSQRMISGWDKLAEQEGFLVAFPQGTKFPQRWDAGATWSATDIDDVQFFHDMYDDILSQSSADARRVYVNGFSNGGGMTVRLGCDAADKIAAIGSVAGAVVDTVDCNPSRPLPLMAFHGTGDPVVNFDGMGMQYQLLREGAKITKAPTYFLGAEEWTALWAEFNGCDPSPIDMGTHGDVSGMLYTNCDENAEVILYTIDRGGHTWPGGFPLVIVGKTSNDINATEEMWRFFQNYQVEHQ